MILRQEGGASSGLLDATEGASDAPPESARLEVIGVCSFFVLGGWVAVPTGQRSTFKLRNIPVWTVLGTSMLVGGDGCGSTGLFWKRFDNFWRASGG